MAPRASKLTMPRVRPHAQSHRATSGATARVLWLVLAAICLAWSSAAWAQPGPPASVNVEVSQRSITVDDELTLVITAEGNYDEIALPELGDWNVTGTYQSTQFTIVMGRRSSSKKVTQTLTPRRDGNLVIGAVRLLSGGQAIAQSQPLSIAVRKAAEVPAMSAAQAANLQRRAGESVFVHPSLSKGAVYEGEPFVLTFELWVAINTGVSDVNFANTPSFDAFSMTDLLAASGRPPQNRRSLNRQQYNVLTLKQDLLVPLSSGKQRIGSMDLRMVVGDMFNQRRLTVKSPPLELDVLPLPDQGRPNSFKPGQIGNFEISASLDRDKVGVGERAVVTIAIKGKGNLPGIKAPDFPAVPGVEAELLPGRDQPGIQTSTAGIEGEVVYSYIAIPSKAGKLQIPPFELGMFDPDARAYRVAKTAPLSLQVVASAASSTGPSLAPSELRPVLAELALVASGGNNGGGTSAAFWALFALPLLGFGAAEWTARRAQQRAANAHLYRAKGAADAAMKSIQSIANKNGVPSALVGELAGAFQTFLRHRFGLAPTAGRPEISRRLQELEASERALAELEEALDSLDFARFAPSSVGADDVHRTAKRLSSLVADIDQLGNRQAVER